MLGFRLGVLMVRRLGGSSFPRPSLSTVACWDMSVMIDVFFLFSFFLGSGGARPVWSLLAHVGGEGG